MDIEKYLEKRIKDLREARKHFFDLAFSEDVKPHTQKAYESISNQFSYKAEELEILQKILCSEKTE